MKKKLLFVIMVCAVLALAVVLVGCGDTKLANPRNLNVGNGYFSWGEVKGADGYLIYFNDDLVTRYYVETNYLAVDDPEIRSSLKSGTVNEMYIRAVNLDKKKLPINMSDRSLIKFDYSRQLATPNKVGLKGDKFNWRAVSEAKDYQAYVRRNGDTEGKLYKMNWATGTANVSGTIIDLPDGAMYYVSIVACAEGFDNSNPSIEVPYDKTVVKVDEKQYYAYVGDVQILLAEDEEDGIFAGEVSLKADSTVTVKDNKGTTYNLEGAEIADGDYQVRLNAREGKATLVNVTNYYLYTSASAEGVKLLPMAGGFSTVVTLTEGMTYSIKDDEGNLISNYSDDSANKGTAFAAGTFTISVSADGSEISVKAGGEIVTEPDDKPIDEDPDAIVDGKWRVFLHYNYEGAPDPIVVLVEAGRTMDTPATPVRDGYTFGGWFEDSTCVEDLEFKFSAKKSYEKITARTDLYAKWTKNTTTEPDPVEPCTNHVDTNGDGKCDKCGAQMQSGPNPVEPCTNHVDANGDGKCDKCGTQMQSEPVPVDTYGKIYLDLSGDSVKWFTSDNAVINVHIWYEDGTHNNWPGAKMTLNSDGIYEAEYYTSRKVKGIIFTRNDPNPNPKEGSATEWDRIEIGEIAFDGERPVYVLKTYRKIDGQITFTGKWLKVGEKEIEEKGDKNLYLDFRDISWFASQGAKLYAYVWYTDGSQNATYPGKEMTFTTDASAIHYSAYVDYFSTKTIAGVIFTRNDPNAPITGEGASLWNKVEISGAALNFNGALPAFRLTDVNGYEGTGYWESEDAAKTATPVIEEPEPEPTTMDVFYYNATWESVKAYAWTGEGNSKVEYLGAWSGMYMSAVEGKAGWWKIAIDKNAQKVIFTNGTAQTDDLVLNANALYYKDGAWTATYPAEEPEPEPVWDGTIHVDVTGVTWFEDLNADAYLYVWYSTQPETNNHAFPGVKMTKIAPGIYSAKIDTTKPFAGLIVSRCDPANGAKWNQSNNVTEMPENHLIVITSMAD